MLFLIVIIPSNVLHSNRRMLLLTHAIKMHRKLHKYWTSHDQITSKERGLINLVLMVVCMTFVIFIAKKPHCKKSGLELRFRIWIYWAYIYFKLNCNDIFIICAEINQNALKGTFDISNCIIVFTLKIKYLLLFSLPFPFIQITFECLFPFMNWRYYFLLVMTNIII